MTLPPRCARHPSRLGLGVVLVLAAAVARGEGPPPGPLSSPEVGAAATPAVPAVRPRLPARAVWMNAAGPPTEASLAGRPVVVLVWNARAVPALDTLPWFARLTHYFSPTGRAGGDAAFVLVHVPESANPADTGPAAIAAALDAVPRPTLRGVPVLLDDAAAFYEALGSPAIPTLFVFGRDGRLLDTVVGRIGRYEAQGREVGRTLKRALAAPRPGGRPGPGG